MEIQKEQKERSVPASLSDRGAVRRARTIAAEMRARAEELAAHLRLRPSLAGLCHVVALGVTSAMRDAGLDAVVASDGAHSWTHVRLSTGNVFVDVTASQYGYADVIVRLPSQGPPKGKRRRAGVWLRPFRVAVSGARAEVLCQQTADEMVEQLPPRWWAIGRADMRAALLHSETRLRHMAERG